MKSRYLLTSAYILYHCCPMRAKTEKKVLELVKAKGVMRPVDLDTYGIQRKYLNILLYKGLLDRIGRGLYTAKDTQPTEHHTLAEVCKRVPSGVVCLLSALQFHGLTTQMPHQVWLAIDVKAREPSETSPPLRIMRFSGPAFMEGVEEHDVEGVQVKVYNPAKTVVDCFKFRNKIGLDVALEALRDCRRQRRCSNDDLWRYAKVCRQTKVMQPYLEALA